MNYFKRVVLIGAAVSLLVGCAQGATSAPTTPGPGVAGGLAAGRAPGLDPNSPVTITIWHYWTGAVLNAFDAMLNEFNETLGMERGIIVEGVSFGSIGELESAVRASAHEEAGSMDLPNIFSSFPDTAYVTQQLGLLSNLDDYFTPEQQAEYFPPFINRGRIGLEGELRIFPTSKAAEILMVNETDWRPFADEHGFTDADLQTMEGIARVAEVYYHWSGGKAFFGRDAFANMFVIGSKQFGTEIFEVEAGQGTINIDEVAMRRIWDYYYTPFISGYFAAHGRFRSDDVRVGDLLAYVGSTVSAVFFPDEVMIDGVSRPIEATVLMPPLFEGGAPVMVQQGPGKVVTLATPGEQYASLIFLRWFTEPDQNLRFSALTGYMPVRQAAMYPQLIRDAADEAGISLRDVTYDTLTVALGG
ncbi:MAG: extracellular solute-binding protein, partial [Defluviitaleaceae bacterium]|nr:extracellular solute-binding protein [Defluviitaleaceae bacterium]